MKEEWKKIEGYDPWFEVSNLGEVCIREHYERVNYRCTKVVKEVYPKIFKRKIGMCVSLNKVTLPIDILVAKAFVENPNGYTNVEHIDGDCKNNCADNLRWIENVEPKEEEQ